MPAHYGVKSKQRQLRVVNLVANAAGTALTGLDANQASLADTGTGVKTITLDTAFASSDYCVQVTTATADSHAEVSVTSAGVFVVSTFDTGDGTTAKDAICHITVYGSDIEDRY